MPTQYPAIPDSPLSVLSHTSPEAAQSPASPNTADTDSHLPEPDPARSFLWRFFCRSGCIMLLIALAVILFDPFFHYHKPWFGLKAVLTDKEYQCVGSLRNFDYDSVIAGSSVAENYYNDWFNQGFQCKTIKAIRSYGATADLCWMLDTAFETHALKHVFYNMDTASLSADPVPSFALTGCPMYLYNKNPLDDIKYLYNKGVLLEKIPHLAASSLMGDYDEHDSYNWAQWKSFSESQSLRLYARTETVAPMKAEDHYQENLTANLALITERIREHPETDFHIFFPPYSILWWDNIYRNGDLEAYLYNMEQAVEELLTYDNVSLFYFQDEAWIIEDLNLYMDTLHFSQDINQYMAEEMIAGRDRLTAENYQDVFAAMKTYAYEIVEELMLLYEERIGVG